MPGVSIWSWPAVSHTYKHYLSKMLSIFKVFITICLTELVFSRSITSGEVRAKGTDLNKLFFYWNSLCIHNLTLCNEWLEYVMNYSIYDKLSWADREEFKSRGSWRGCNRLESKTIPVFPWAINSATWSCQSPEARKCKSVWPSASNRGLWDARRGGKDWAPI